MGELATFTYRDFSARIREKNYNIPIYKFIPFEYVVSIFRANALQIFQTLHWEDVYENFLLKSVASKDEQKNLKQLVQSYYGQCWTFRKETDALWRIYSPTKQSVRLQTTIRKLGNATRQCVETSADITCATIGPVKYFQPAKFRKWVQARGRSEGAAPALIDSLFIKRTAFSHESELRLILQRKELIAQKGKPHIKLAIDPNKFFNEIALDPRVTDDQVTIYTHMLRKLGYENRIYRSPLYEFQPVVGA